MVYKPNTPSEQVARLTLTGVSSRGPHGPILMHGHGLLAITYDVHIRTRHALVQLVQPGQRRVYSGTGV